MILGTFLPEIILGIGACSLLGIGAFLSKKNSSYVISSISKFIIFITMIYIIIKMYSSITTLSSEEFFLLDRSILSDFLKVLILLFGGSILLVSRISRKIENLDSFEYPILILFSLLGMLIMVSANNLLSLFMGLELQSLSLYILSAIKRDDEKASEASLKYFILGAISTGLFLFGVSLIYGFTGTIYFDKMHYILNYETSSPGIQLGLIFFLAGLAFKISSAPFHMWAPDVYEGTPTSVTLFLAIVPKVAAMGVLIQIFMVPFKGIIKDWQFIIAFLSVTSMIWGSISILSQKNIKRFLAYSSINHIGYALIGLIVGTIDGIKATLIYMILYSFMVLGIFSCLLRLINANHNYKNVNDLKGLYRLNPKISFVMAFLLFSMAGIPPLSGFLGKLYIFQSAISNDFYILAIIGVITSVISAAYYLYLIKVILMDESVAENNGSISLKKDPLIDIILLLIVLCLTWFFIDPNYLLDLVTKVSIGGLFNL